MSSRSRAATLLVGLIGALWLVALPVRAERIQSDYVLIREDDVVSEDLYAAGNRVEVYGVVEGDLLAVAFEEVRIDGEVTGSVVAVSSSVVVNGKVGGSVRAAAVRVEVAGIVGGDVVAAAGTVVTGGEVGRDVLAWAWEGRNTAVVGRNLEGQSRRLLLGGEVAGDVEVTVGRLDVEPGLEVGGDLAYRSGRPFDVGAASVTGSVIHQGPAEPNVRLQAVRLLTMVLAFLLVGAVGLVTFAYAPDRASRAAAAAVQPWRSLGAGLQVLAVPVVLLAGVAVVVGLSPPGAGLPLAVVLAPVILGVVGFLLLGAVIAPVPVLTMVGQRLLPRRSPPAAFLAGAVLLAITWLLPLAGPVLTGLVILLGLGAWLRAWPSPE